MDTDPLAHRSTCQHPPERVMLCFDFADHQAVEISRTKPRPDGQQGRPGQVVLEQTRKMDAGRRLSEQRGGQKPRDVFSAVGAGLAQTHGLPWKVCPSCSAPRERIDPSATRILH